MTNEVHFEGKIAQKAIIIKGNKVLLVRDPRMKEIIWEIPGGRMNVGEEPRTALQREIQEELGIECNVHEVVHLEQFVQGNENKMAFVIVYRASIKNEAQKSDNFSIDKNEVCEFNWFSKDDALALNLFPEYRRALEIFFKEF